MDRLASTPLAKLQRDREVRLLQVELGQLAQAIAGPLAGIGRHEHGRSSATRSCNTRTEYGQSMRSAITVAGIVGNSFNSARTSGSTASTTEPFLARS
jgi:hypothetical protein